MRRTNISKKTLGIIIGINTAVTTAAITIVGLLVPQHAVVIKGVIEAVVAVYGICLVFMKSLPDDSKK